jgi:hypothetical protein
MKITLVRLAATMGLVATALAPTAPAAADPHPTDPLTCDYQLGYNPFAGLPMDQLIDNPKNKKIISPCVEVTGFIVGDSITRNGDGDLTFNLLIDNASTPEDFSKYILGRDGHDFSNFDCNKGFLHIEIASPTNSEDTKDSIWNWLQAKVASGDDQVKVVGPWTLDSGHTKFWDCGRFTDGQSEIHPIFSIGDAPPS